MMYYGLSTTLYCQCRSDPVRFPLFAISSPVPLTPRNGRSPIRTRRHGRSLVRATVRQRPRRFAIVRLDPRSKSSIMSDRTGVDQRPFHRSLGAELVDGSEIPSGAGRRVWIASLSCRGSVDGFAVGIVDGSRRLLFERRFESVSSTASTIGSHRNTFAFGAVDLVSLGPEVVCTFPTSFSELLHRFPRDAHQWKRVVWRQYLLARIEKGRDEGIHRPIFSRRKFRS